MMRKRATGQRASSLEQFPAMRSPLTPKHWRMLILVALAMLVGVEAYQLVQRLAFEVSGTFDTDLTVFFGMGRGILNGLTPYRDLFEIKPPGIFLLSALSLWLSGDTKAFMIIDALCILALPFSVIAAGFSQSYFGKKTWERFLWLALFGLVLALYVADQAGQGRVESFAVLPAVAFVGVMVMHRDRRAPSWLRTGLLAACLLFAIGLKEPFFLSMLAAAVILLPSLRHFTRLFLIPLGIAAAIGLAVMAVLGYLEPYFTVYVKHILGWHIYYPWGSSFEPLWVRCIDLWRIWRNFDAYSIFLGLLVGLLWVLALAFFWDETRPRGAEWVWVLLRWGVVTVLTSLSIGLAADYYGHHFIFGVPAYVALFFVCLQKIEGLREHRKHIAAGLIILLLVLLGSAAIWHRERDYADETRIWHDWSDPLQEAAVITDRVMDQCHMDRYLWFVDRSPTMVAYTRHSPYGPLFVEYTRWLPASQRFIDGYVDAVNHAPILVMKTFNTMAMFQGEQEYIQSNFTDQPPACAQNFKQPSVYKILFRKNG